MPQIQYLQNLINKTFIKNIDNTPLERIIFWNSSFLVSITFYTCFSFLLTQFI